MTLRRGSRSAGMAHHIEYLCEALWLGAGQILLGLGRGVRCNSAAEMAARMAGFLASGRVSKGRRQITCT